MPQDTIVCPRCGELIKISQVIVQDIEAEIKQKYEKLFSNWQSTELERMKSQSIQEAQQISVKDIEKLKRDLEGRDKEIREIKEKEAEFQKRESNLKAEALKLANKIEENDKIFKKKLEDETKAIREEARRRRLSTAT
jgi:tyrosyl-tRNA synthetase